MKKPPDDGHCKLCFYWVARSDDTGTCQIHPPSQVTAGGLPWPVTMDSDFCGSFERDPDPQRVIEGGREDGRRGHR